MVLRAEGLLKVYKGRMVVRGVSLQVTRGEIVGLLGANGAGKTTTFYMIAGLIQPTEGNIYLDGTCITRLPMYKRAQMGIGYLPQEASVFRELTVEENLLAILELRGYNKREQKEKTEQLLEELSLTHVRKNLGSVLSGGERRRTEIARALATDPKFLLLDEPFAGVDPIAVEEIQNIVNQLKEKNIGILITDHNVDETLAITDHSYLMFEGRVLKAGTAQDLANDEEVRRVYLGAHFELKRRVKLTLQPLQEEDTSSPASPEPSLLLLEGAPISSPEDSSTATSRHSAAPQGDEEVDPEVQGKEKTIEPEEMLEASPHAPATDLSMPFSAPPVFPGRPS